MTSYPKEETSKEDFFNGLSAEDNVLIARSFAEILELPLSLKCRYRDLVEQLMKNTGVIFGYTSMQRLN